MNLKASVIFASLLLTQLGFEATGQVPFTIGGLAVELTITAGAYPLASSGSGRFLASATDNTYGLVGLSAGVGSTYGTYGYTKTSGSEATLTLSDVSAGLSTTTTIRATSPTTGTFHTTVPAYPGAYQSGSIRIYSGQAPAAIEGMSFRVQVQAGAYPFSSSGSFDFITGTMGNIYRVVNISGAADSQGLYTYSKVSQSASSLSFTDSQTGRGYAQTFSWNTATSGAYVIRDNSSGGFQAGTFSMTSAVSTPWAEATNMGGGWRRSSWFGDFNVTYYPWTYHAQHGWMYTFGTDPASIWLWTTDMGFVWTGSGVYPWLWSDTDHTWLYYAKGSQSPRWFFNWNAQRWESHNP